MADPYAVAADLLAFTGQIPPTDADRQLTRASELLDDHVTAGFEVDANGIPVDPDLALALKNAACAQVEAWLEIGEEHDIAGYPQNTAITRSKVSTDRQPDELAPRARRFLRSAGLLAAEAD